MGLALALVFHILGTCFAAVVIYIVSPMISELIGEDLRFVYTVLYALLAIWSVRTAKKIETGKHEVANELESIVSKEDK